MEDESGVFSFSPLSKRNFSPEPETHYHFLILSASLFNGANHRLPNSLLNMSFYDSFPVCTFMSMSM